VRTTGVVVVDKPSGPTSFGVVRVVRRALRVRKAGHTGTLDPFATGVLVVCVGRATRLVPWLQAGEKEYVATVELGVETDTLDLQGEVVRRAPVGALARSAVEAALAGFVGRIEQVPPAWSAVKVAGRRAYDLARRGERVELAAREVRVHGLELEAFEPPRLVLRVRSGPGFYVRALARDLGEALGLPAHLGALRRTATGGFGEAEAVPLDLLEADPPAPLPMAEAVGFLPALALTVAEEGLVNNGRLPDDLQPPTDLGETGACRLLRPDGRLAAISELRQGRLTLARVFPDVAGDS